MNRGDKILQGVSTRKTTQLSGRVITWKEEGGQENIVEE